MEKSTQSLEEWFAKVDSLVVESDAQTAALKAALNEEKLGSFLIEQELSEPIAA